MTCRAKAICRGKAIHALGECDCYFKPRDFLELLERERRWCELLITAIMTRRELRDLNVKLIADDTVAMAIEIHARVLRN